MSEFSYMCTPQTTPYKYKTVIQVFNEITTSFPDKEILIYRGIEGTRESLTCRQLQTQATKVAGYLLRKGIKKGDKVAFFGPNTLEWVIAELAIIMAGGIVVHVPFGTTDTRDAYEVASIAECKAFLIDPGKRDQYLDMVLQLDSYITGDPSVSALVLLRESKHLSSFDNLQGILKLKEETEVDFPTLYPEDDIVIFTTSGSTGKPKMVPKTHFQMINHDMIFSEKMFNDRPFSWSGGTPIPSVYLGEARVFCDSSIALDGRNTMKIWEIIKEEQCTSALLLPYFLSDLVAVKENYKDSFKLDEIITSGEAICNSHPKVIGIFTRTLSVAYGSTEEFWVSVLPPTAIGGEILVGDAGKLKAGMEVKIIDEDGNVLRKGKNGELCIRSMVGFNEYYKNASYTEEVMLPGNWFRSGDIAQINENNHIVVKGRIKGYISRGSRKIIQASIEKIIFRMNGIKNVSVVGVPDKRLYENICVCYVTDPDHVISPTDVKQFCMKMFFGHDAIDGLGEMPTYFLQFHSLPLFFSGKINKRQLRFDAIQQLGLSDEMDS